MKRKTIWERYAHLDSSETFDQGLCERDARMLLHHNWYRDGRETSVQVAYYKLDRTGQKLTRWQHGTAYNYGNDCKPNYLVPAIPEQVVIGPTTVALYAYDGPMAPLVDIWFK